ncbi:MAG TPA: class A beta-lactamase [Thermoanaerobaculia bacterium]|nr:class A beta-lactamase [Thermoanaerobaculia bacterium]
MRTVTAVAAFLLLTGFIRNVEERIERIAAEIDSTVGVAALHIESGRRTGVRAGERFPMGSVYKLPIAVAFLREVDAGRFSLADEVTIDPADFAPHHSPIRDAARGRPLTITLRQAVEVMMGQSDNTAADLLLRLAGGGEAVTRVLREFGISDIDITRPEREIATGPGDSASPAAVLSLLERIYTRQDGLSPPSRDLLLRIMSTSPTGQRRIKAGAPARATVAHKSGTMPGTVNDAGIITSPDGRDHVLIVVFTTGGRTSTMNQRERVVSTITRAVYRDFVGWSPFRRPSARAER